MTFHDSPALPPSQRDSGGLAGTVGSVTRDRGGAGAGGGDTPTAGFGSGDDFGLEDIEITGLTDPPQGDGPPPMVDATGGDGPGVIVALGVALAVVVYEVRS